MKKKLIPMIIFLFLWAGISAKVSPIILPSPLRVFYTSLFLLQNNYNEILITLSRLGASLILTYLIGIFLAFGIVSSKNLKILIQPGLLFMQSTPIISWILLALIWFDSRYIPIFIICINAIPILVLNVVSGMEGIDKKILEMASIYNISKKDRFYKIQLPSLIRFLLPATEIILGSSFKVIVMAEVISRVGSGIGNGLNIGWLNIETDTILGWTLIIYVLSFLISKTILTSLKNRFRRYL
ncbi:MULTISPECIES: ABC transporter permease [Psychrilyobacter]|uniref:ABC transporter permease subunit n=1 Tax=Psychrilyobacter piezotolerans TaxID=2293438 RepID=A0ABX9KHW0_9FUSO|nr:MULTISPECIES: ABC transporter permease subunit [Psychrilyobacter]MCS5422263.1 ABC transporter permease subunit [Psychrilyobacter sp. S5]NDI77545.1 ABC transporter permease subunit [Psychrilyobacter piezotolerans]RDE62944.1 ABC transporter permease subunit [Psychrilyobacter sp. S5]REI41702.1 ABC transporter permease subunit [Psychrilyobacter piezotolerans]